jgi:hypothetical protein
MILLEYVGHMVRQSLRHVLGQQRLSPSLARLAERRPTTVQLRATYPLLLFPLDLPGSGLAIHPPLFECWMDASQRLLQLAEAGPHVLAGIE